MRDIRAPSIKRKIHSDIRLRLSSFRGIFLTSVWFFYLRTEKEKRGRRKKEINV